jgi:hypothetical protein
MKRLAIPRVAHCSESYHTPLGRDDKRPTKDGQGAWPRPSFGTRPKED